MVTLLRNTKAAKMEAMANCQKGRKKISPELLTTNNMKKQPGETLNPLNSVLERFNHQRSFNAHKLDVVQQC